MDSRLAVVRSHVVNVSVSALLLSLSRMGSDSGQTVYITRSAAIDVIDTDALMVPAVNQ